VSTPTKKPVIKTSTFAKVTVQFDIEVGSWGPECGLDQVYRQASESAQGKVRRAFDLPRMSIKTVRVEAITTRTDISS
jgi:hypothetical protein